MQRYQSICSLFLIFSFQLLQPLFAQTETIHGKIIDDKTKEPLPFASVYYNNTTIGTQSDVNGRFSLPFIGLNHQMIISYLGYETINFTISDNYTGKLLIFQMAEQANEIKEIAVHSTRSKTWHNNLEFFKELAIGKGFFASQCKLLNPGVLQFTYDTANFLMKAVATDELKIENPAFGYLIHYALTKFEYNVITRAYQIIGHPYFEAMPGNSAKKKRWEDNQEIAYLGSMNHFIRCAYSRTLANEGFEVHKLKRVPNPDFVPDPNYESTTKRLQKMPLYQATRRDNPYQQSIYKMEQNRFVEKIDEKPAHYEDFIFQDSSGTHLKFKNFLQVIFLNEQAGWTVSGHSKLSSIISLKGDAANFDEKGRIIDTSIILLEGHWATQLLGDLLPLDYVPKKK